MSTVRMVNAVRSFSSLPSSLLDTFAWSTTVAIVVHFRLAKFTEVPSPSVPQTFEKSGLDLLTSFRAVYCKCYYCISSRAMLHSSQKSSSLQRGIWESEVRDEKRGWFVILFMLMVGYTSCLTYIHISYITSIFTFLLLENKFFTKRAYF